MHKRGLCRHAVSVCLPVCLSVCHVMKLLNGACVLVFYCNCVYLVPSNNAVTLKSGLQVTKGQ